MRKTINCSLSGPRYCVLLSSTLLLSIIFSATLTANIDDTFGNDGAPMPSRSLYSETYHYHNYTQLVAEMQQLEAENPDLIKLDNAQEEFGVPDCVGNYKVWMMRITNRSNTEAKPEVLFLGGHHGDEPVSVEAAFYFAKWLVKTYDQDPASKFLVDNRDIYVVPLVNPWGLEHGSRYNSNGIDINRDYPFGDVYDPLNSTEAKSVFELQSRHRFITGLTWHAGTAAIGYSWGCGSYDDGNAETPDDSAFSALAQKMSEVAASNILTYPYGRMDQMPQFGPLEGTWEDFAYGGAWDVVNQYPGLSCNGSRTLSFITEISYAKQPTVSDLGSTEGIDGGAGDGYIPKNIRMAKLLTDLAIPYIEFLNKDEIPAAANSGEKVPVKWTLGGCLKTDETRILYGLGATLDQLQTDPQFATEPLSGGSKWSDAEYFQELVMPNEPGTYTFVVEGKVDQAFLNQDNPTPSLAPQSFYVNQRTDDNWSDENNGRVLDGCTRYLSDPFTIVVSAGAVSTGVKVKMLTASGPIEGVEGIIINWTVEIADPSKLELTRLQWGSDPDPMTQRKFISDELNSTGADLVAANGSSKILHYSLSIDLAGDSTDYYFIAFAKGEGAQSWSEVIRLWLSPRVVIDGYTKDLALEGDMEIMWHLESVSQITFVRALLSYYPKVGTTYHLEFGNYSGLQEGYRANTTLPFRSGAYYVLVQVQIGAVSVSSEELQFYIGPELRVLAPSVEVNMSGVDGTGAHPLLNIRGAKAISSVPGIAEADQSEAAAAYYVIYDKTGRNRQEGKLNYDTYNASWGAKVALAEDLEEGTYHVQCYFEVGTLFNSSTYVPGDRMEFYYEAKVSDPDAVDQSDLIWIIVLLVGIIVLLFIAFVFYKIKAMDEKAVLENGPGPTPRTQARGAYTPLRKTKEKQPGKRHTAGGISKKGKRPPSAGKGMGGSGTSEPRKTARVR